STPEAKIDGPAALFTAMSRVVVNGGNEPDDLTGFLKNSIIVRFLIKKTKGHAWLKFLFLKCLVCLLSQFLIKINDPNITRY
ncbi:hypothetical protein ACVGV7_00115, partial [Enterobacter intestinihominis]